MLTDIGRVRLAIGNLRDRVRSFFYAVVLVGRFCTSCGHEVRMHEEGQCTCSCGRVFDPTIDFQKSSCCEAHLRKKLYHYACTVCEGTVNSRFLFDERIYDANYFKVRMREARQRKRNHAERVRRLLAGSRSDVIGVDGMPNLETIPGLIEALNEFVGNEPVPLSVFESGDPFDLSRYREAILSFLGDVSVLFDTFPALSVDVRTDRVRRFLTLIYLEHEREVRLSQYGDDILVEAYAVD